MCVLVEWRGEKKRESVCDNDDGGGGGAKYAEASGHVRGEHYRDARDMRECNG